MAADYCFVRAMLYCCTIGTRLCTRLRGNVRKTSVRLHSVHRETFGSFRVHIIIIVCVCFFFSRLWNRLITLFKTTANCYLPRAYFRTRTIWRTINVEKKQRPNIRRHGVTYEIVSERVTTVYSRACKHRNAFVVSIDLSDSLSSGLAYTFEPQSTDYKGIICYIHGQRFVLVRPRDLRLKVQREPLPTNKSSFIYLFICYQ